MKTCVEEGILQAFLDGELSPETSQTVAAHLAACAACGARAQEAEAELSLFALAMPAALSVPTERLRERLDAAITGTRQLDSVLTDARRESRWRVWLNGIAASLTPAPSHAAAFAGLLVAVLLSVFFAANRLSPREVGLDEIAAIPTPALTNELPILSPMPTVSPVVDAVGRPESSDRIDGGARLEVVKNQQPLSRKATGDVARRNTVRQSDAPVFLPGEKTYLTAIASLTTTIESRGPQSLPPTLRAEYERNLAVVDQAIISTRVAARRNPQDTDAHEFLRSAYQNKVELLSAVAEQSQLASIKD